MLNAGSQSGESDLLGFHSSDRPLWIEVVGSSEYRVVPGKAMLKLILEELLDYLGQFRDWLLEDLFSSSVFVQNGEKMLGHLCLQGGDAEQRKDSIPKFSLDQAIANCLEVFAKILTVKMIFFETEDVRFEAYIGAPWVEIV